MCRLVGIVASEVTRFGLVLKEAPRSLARLSAEHPDGWGVAAFGGPESQAPEVSPQASRQPEGPQAPEASPQASRQPEGPQAPEVSPQASRQPEGQTEKESGFHQGGWQLHKGTARASECTRFSALAERSAGTILIAHIRQKTVGTTKIENTHPFAQSAWVFAHNGTVKDQAYVRSGVSARRLAEVTGDTDSEVLFAHLLTRLDEAGVTHAPPSDASRARGLEVLSAATAELRRRNVGAFNFLLSNGSSCFVHRFGRTLYLLERRPDPPSSASSLDEQAALAKWRMRRHAVLVASERLTDEPWRELPEGALLRVDRDPIPRIEWPRARDDERVAS